MTSGALYADGISKARPRERADFRAGLGAALVFGLALGIWISWPLFAVERTVPDDARAFLFWMERWNDPGLFPDDRIADYFQSMSPRLFTLLYRGAFELGLDPIEANRLLPLVLTAITTVFIYRLAVRLCPIPLAGLLAATFVNIELWMKDDLTSGTPRAFFTPLTAMFLHGLAQRNIVLTALSAVLMAGIYPAALLVALAATTVWLGILVLRGEARRRDWMLAAGAGLAGGIALLPFALAAASWGAAISAEIARSWPEFQAGGRTRFFFDDLWVYWICSPRSGLEPVEWCRYLNEDETRASFETVSLLLLAAAMSVPFATPFLTRPARSLLGGPHAVLPAFLIGSLACFALAHAMLFELHLPSRYVQHSLRMLAGIGFGIGAAVLVDALAEGAASMGRRRLAVAIPLALFLPGAVLTAPLFGKESPFDVKYRTAEPAALFDYLALQPRDILVASLARQADDIPLHTGRRVLFSHKHSVPYHPAFYQPMREALVAYIRALYSDDLTVMQRFIRDHGVSHLIVHRAAFSPDHVHQAWWSRQFPDEAEEVRRRLAEARPAVERLAGPCVRGHYDNLLVIGARCLLRLEPER